MGLASLHPGVCALYFLCLIAGTLMLRHPLCLAASLLGAVCCLFSLQPRRLLRLTAWLLPLTALFILWYCAVHHFGITVLGYTFIGNPITLESMVSALVLALTADAVLLWLGSVTAVFTTDKVVWLLGRLTPRLGLFAALILRAAPRIAHRFRQMRCARQGIGRRGGILPMLTGWSVEQFLVASDAMAARGGRLPGRTAFSPYPFSDGDRWALVLLAAGAAATAAGQATGHFHAIYDPAISLAPAGPLLPYGMGWLGLCLLGAMLQLLSLRRFSRGQSACE